MSRVRRQLGGPAALWLGLRRRRDVPEGSVALGYGRDLRSVLAVLLVLSVVEAVVLAVVVPWAWLETPLLALSAVGFLWILGFAASTSAHPHLVDDERVLLRCAHLGGVSVPSRAVVAARRSTTTGHRRVVASDGEHVAVALAGGTDVTVALAPGTVVVTDDGERLRVSSVSFAVDEPDRAVAVLRAVAPSA